MQAAFWDRGREHPLHSDTRPIERPCGLPCADPRPPLPPRRHARPVRRGSARPPGGLNGQASHRHRLPLPHKAGSHPRGVPPALSKHRKARCRRRPQAPGRPGDRHPNTKDRRPNTKKIAGPRRQRREGERKKEEGEGRGRGEGKRREAKLRRTGRGRGRNPWDPAPTTCKNCGTTPTASGIWCNARGRERPGPPVANDVRNLLKCYDRFG